MKYRRIDKDTVQCIVTGEDLEEYGISMTDIFEKNEQGEGFLRNLIEGAHEEVGYTCNGNIAMQISPFKDNGMVITFSEESENTLKNFLDHMRQLFEAIGDAGDAADSGMPGETDAVGTAGDRQDVTDAARSGWKESKHRQVGTNRPRLPEKQDQVAEVRIFEFASIGDAIEFAKVVSNPSQVRSCLLKCDGMFYLVVMKNRMSWENYNKMTSMAFDFAEIIFDSKEKLIYLGEHSELYIKNGALAKLAKI